MAKIKVAIPLNPDMLIWARRKAGLNLDQAVERIGLKDGKKTGQAVDRLLSWEEGEAQPSFNQLKKISSAYRRPIVTFFLSDPPKESDLLKDYRTIGDHGVLEESPEFAAFKLRIEAMYDTLKEIYTFDPLPENQFVATISGKTPISETIDILKRMLNWEESYFGKLNNATDLFKALREAAHKSGIFIVLRGDLGSYHSKISPEEFRGIAIADREVPLIIINPNDSKTAMVFTLVHELVHILLGNKGISNISEITDEARVLSVQNEEKYCNEVAANFLVPKHLLMEAMDKVKDPENVESLVVQLSDIFKISRFVVMRRLKNLGFIEYEQYWDLWRIFYSQLNNKNYRTPTSRGGSDLNRNTLDRFYLGRKLIHRVIEAADGGIISYSDASRTLHVSPGRFDKVMA